MLAVMRGTQLKFQLNTNESLITTVLAAPQQLDCNLLKSPLQLAITLFGVPCPQQGTQST